MESLAESKEPPILDLRLETLAVCAEETWQSLAAQTGWVTA